MACVSVGIFVFLAVARGHYRLVSISILESVSGGWLVGSRDRQWCDTFDRMRADWIDPVVGALWGKKSAGIEVGKRQPGRSISLEWTEYDEIRWNAQTRLIALCYCGLREGFFREAGGNMAS